MQSPQNEISKHNKLQSVVGYFVVKKDLHKYQVNLMTSDKK